MQTTRPAFELESYEDATLPHGKRLTHENELKGHTILAMVMNASGPNACGTESVIVTETHCWMVLDASDNQCYDEKAEVEIELDPGRYNTAKTPETLQDYLSAEELFEIGVIVAQERDLLVKKRQQAEQEQKAKKAENLRKQLAELEGGAA